MASGKKALGKGLGALIGESKGALSRAPGGEGRLRELPLDAISMNRRQPRRTFVDEELAELAASIKSLGVVQPVVVRPLALSEAAAEGAAGVAGDALGGADAASVEGSGTGHGGRGLRYELIAGERRLRAARLAGLEYIPALIRPADEVSSLEIAVAENVAREDLNSIEEAYAYASLVDEFGLTHERVAELVGRSRAAVSNILRLLELPDEVQRMIETAELSEGHGRALLALPDHGQRTRTARAVVAQGLSVRATEQLIRKMLADPSPSAQTRPADPALDALVDELYGLLAAPVRIRSGRRGGIIQIAFRDRDEMERLVELLRTLQG